ncbi:MAG: thiamine phosphate synthase [Gemmatimonadetes bacterium]|nr:MAG: thiamine phosphate synthase [Gemmatimonadota bacterium]
MSLPPLHVVTDESVLAAEGFAARARAVLEAGGGALALHLRAHRLGGRRHYELAARLAPEAAAAGAELIVNDRLDVALALGLGVHLAERSLPPAAVAALEPGPAFFGASVHGATRAREAAAAGARYLIVGTIYATGSHPGREPAGPVLLERVAAEAAGVPLVAIGGVTPARVAEVARAGAAGVAVRAGVWHAGDPAAAVEAYLEAWRAAVAGAPAGAASATRGAAPATEC